MGTSPWRVTQEQPSHDAPRAERSVNDVLARVMRQGRLGVHAPELGVLLCNGDRQGKSLCDVQPVVFTITLNLNY